MGPRPPCAYPNPWMTIYIRAYRKKKVYITHIDSESALLTAIENTADSLSGSNSFARKSTAKLERYKTLSNVSSYLFITSMSPRASSSSSTGLQLQHNTASSISDRSNVLMAYLEDKREDFHEMLHGLVAKYHQDDIFACDVTELAFRRSPMADGTSTSLFKEQWIVSLSILFYGCWDQRTCVVCWSRQPSFFQFGETPAWWFQIWREFWICIRYTTCIGDCDDLLIGTISL